MENTEQSSASVAPQGVGGGKEKVEKQARQLAYDTRYKVRQTMSQQSGSKADPAAVRKAYMAQLAKSPAPPAVKARAKQMLLGENFVNVDNLLSKNISSVFDKVFSEHHEKDADGNIIPHEDEEVIEEDKGERTFKVRVTDKKTNNSYVRNATRDKIRELRANPNISSVEMTEYGEPTKSEKYKGKSTAAVKSGKGDEVSGKDHSIDLKKEGYSLKSENFDGFLELVEKSKEEKKNGKITGEGVDNTKLVKVFPDDKIKEESENVTDGMKKKLEEWPKWDPKGAQEKRDALKNSGGGDHTIWKPGVDVGLSKDVDITKDTAGAVKQIGQDKVVTPIANVGKKFAKNVAKNVGKAAVPLAGGLGAGYVAKKITDKVMGHGEKNEEVVHEEGEYGNDQEAPAPGTVCFDGGAALPATIKPIGDPREMPTALNLIKNKWRAKGLKMSYEPKGDHLDEDTTKVEEGKVGAGVGGALGNIAGRTVGAAIAGPAGAEVGKYAGAALGAGAMAKKGKKGRAAVGGALGTVLPGAGLGLGSGLGGLVAASREVEGNLVDEEKRELVNKGDLTTALGGAIGGPGGAAIAGGVTGKKGRKLKRAAGGAIGAAVGSPGGPAGMAIGSLIGGKLTNSYTPEGKPIDEVVGAALGALAGNQLLAPVLAKQAAPALVKAGIGKGVAKALTGKTAAAAIGAAGGEILDPLKKQKDKNPVSAAVGGGVGSVVAGKLGASKKVTEDAFTKPDNNLLDIVNSITSGENIEESEKVAQGAMKRAKELAQKRRNKGYKEQGYNAYRPGKNERAGYNLASAARSSDSSPETQSTKKKSPAGTDTSQIGHYKKRDEKVTVGKRGGKLKTPKYKLSFSQRVDHHSNKALNRRDPKQNPKHEANK